MVPESPVHHLCWIPIRLKDLPRWFFTPINLETVAKNVCYAMFQAGHMDSIMINENNG